MIFQIVFKWFFVLDCRINANLEKIVFKHWFLFGQERKKKENHGKNANIIFIRIEVAKRFEVTATYFFFPMWLELLGEKKELLMHYCLSDDPYMVPSVLSQADMIKWCSFSCMVLGDVINIIHKLSLPSLLLPFPPQPQKWNAKFCHLGVVIITTAADIARGRNRTGSRKMWPKVHDFKLQLWQLMLSLPEENESLD